MLRVIGKYSRKGRNRAKDFMYKLSIEIEGS